MFLTPETIVLALVFQFFRACGALFFQKHLFYKREKAPLFSVFLLAPAAFYFLQAIEGRCSLYFKKKLRLRHAFLLKLHILQGIEGAAAHRK